MKNNSFAPALASLINQHGEQCARQDLFLSVLSRAETAENERLIARLVDPARELVPQQWVLCDNGVYVHIAMISGRSFAFRAERIDDVAAALDAADPLLAAIETVSAIVLEPVDMCECLDEELIIARVTRDEGSDQVYIAVPLESTIWTGLEGAAQAIGIDYSDIPVDFSLSLKAARLCVEDVAGLAAGDLLLVGNASVPATLMWPTQADTPAMAYGRYDFSSGVFIYDDSVVSKAAAAGRTDEIVTADGSRPDFAVPLSVTFACGTASAGELAATQNGGSLNIGRLSTNIIAALLAGGSTVAVGRLVMIADHMAFMVDDRTQQNEPPVAETIGEVA